MNTAEIVIGIPGKWQTRSDIVQDIVDKSEGLLLVGMVLMDIAAHEPFKLEVYEHDPDLSKAFALAGKKVLTESDLQAIHLHTFTLYLIAEGGSLEQAQKVLNIGALT